MCPKYTFSLQITCELFFFSDRPLLCYWVAVCTRIGKTHLKAIQCWCVRQEASVLAHRVIHSVSCTQRGLSSLALLLLAFKECVCVCTRIMYMHIQECVCVLMHAYVPVRTQDNSSGHTCSPYSTAWPVTTGMCEAQVRACTVNRYCYRGVTVKTKLYCTTHVLSSLRRRRLNEEISLEECVHTLQKSL